MIDKKELRRLAEEATPGEWGYDGSYVCTSRNEDGTVYVESWNPVSDCLLTKNAKYIAAANPAAVLALIAENETLKAQFDECARLFVDATEQACKAQRERDQLKSENERMRLALKSAEDAMWKSESNMDNEAAYIRDLLAAMSKGEQA